MPRAVIISVGELSLQPIKALVNHSGVTNTTLTVKDAAYLQNLNALTNQLPEQDKQAECVFVQTADHVYQQVKAFNDVKTLLVYSSPDVYLTQYLSANTDSPNVEHALKQWGSGLQQAINVYENSSANSNESNAIALCSLDDVLAHPAVFLQTIFDKKAEEIATPAPDIVQQTFSLSAAAALVDKDELYELYDDALSVGQLFGDFTVHLSPDSETFNHKSNVLAQAGRNLKQNTEQLAVLRNDIANVKNALATKEEALTQQNEASARLSNQLEEEQKTSAAHAEQNTALEASLQNAQQQTQQVQSELEEQKQALNAAKQQVSAKESELAQLNEKAVETANKLNAVNANLTKKNEEYSALAEKNAASEEKVNTLNAELIKQTQTATELDQKNKAIHGELTTVKQGSELAQLQITQLQEELEATSQKASKLAEVETVLNASKEKQAAADKKLAAAHEELELSALQINQLQEELEATSQKASKLAETETALNASKEKQAAADKKLAAAHEELERSALQISQLQEELEATSQKASKLAETETVLNSSKEKQAAAEKKLAAANEELELSALQVTQLQEELEATFSELEVFKAKQHQRNVTSESQAAQLKASASLKDENALLTKQMTLIQNKLEKSVTDKTALENELQQLQQLQQAQASKVTSDVESENKLQHSELELELASLQISQLQEELEHYYLALQESERSLNKGLTHRTMSSNKIQTKVFDKVTAQGISVTGQYAEGDYKDIHLCLHNVVFPTGNVVENIHAKLIMLSDNMGIEFRARNNEGLFREYEDSTDEYGPYLRYFLTAPESAQAQQQKIVERINASERLLILGCVNAIALQLQNNNIETAVNVTPESWREWRKASLAFSQHVDSLPNWLSFDSVHLREEYVADGYEHLWLVFTGVLLGNVWRNSLELKLSANAVGAADNGEFSNALSMEFRELDDGSAPLMAWPPEDADEYGPKLNVPINNLSELADFTVQDIQLITHLVSNLPSILEKLHSTDKDMQRNKKEWISAVATLFSAVKEGAVETKVEAESESKEQTESATTSTSEALICDEVISAGSYQHIVFLQEGNETKIKLRAENVNPDTFDAEVYLELRDGTSNVIYNSSEFFAEDDYGPCVKIPAETLEALKNEQENEEFKWAVSVYKTLPDEISESANVDELVRLLWKNILNRKSEK